MMDKRGDNMKTMYKKYLSALLALIMCFSLIAPAMPSAYAFGDTMSGDTDIFADQSSGLDSGSWLTQEHEEKPDGSGEPGIWNDDSGFAETDVNTSSGFIWDEESESDKQGGSEEDGIFSQDGGIETETDNVATVEFRLKKSDVVGSSEYIATVTGPELVYAQTIDFFTEEDKFLSIPKDYIDGAMKYRWPLGGDKAVFNLLDENTLDKLEIYVGEGKFLPLQITLSEDGEFCMSCWLIIFALKGADGYNRMRYVLLEDNSAIEQADYDELMGQYLTESDNFAEDAYMTADSYAVLRDTLRENLRYMESGYLFNELGKPADIDLDLTWEEKPENGFHDSEENGFDNPDLVLPEGNEHVDEASGGNDVSGPENAYKGAEGGFSDNNYVPEENAPQDEISGENDENIPADELPDENINSDEILPEWDQNEMLSEGGSDELLPEEGDDEINEEYVALLLAMMDTDPDRYEEILESMTDEEYDAFYKIAFGASLEEEIPETEPEESSGEGLNSDEAEQSEVSSENDEIMGETSSEDDEAINDINDDTQNEETSDDEAVQEPDKSEKSEDPEEEMTGGSDGTDETDENEAGEAPEDEGPGEEGAGNSEDGEQDETDENNAEETPLTFEDIIAAGEKDDDDEEKEEDIFDDGSEAEEIEGEPSESDEPAEGEDALELDIDGETYDGGMKDFPENPSEDLLKSGELTATTKGLAKIGMKEAAPALLRGEDESEQYTADGITLSKLTVRWMSKSTGESEKAGFDPLVFVPESDTMPNQQWQVDFSLEGKGQVDAGSIEIVVPAYIWKDRYGNEPGHLTLAIPEEPDTTNDFAWRRVNDTIVITNTRALSAASKYMVQGTFRMTYPDPNSDIPFDTTYVHDMVDIDTVEPSGYENVGVSDDFYAVMSLTTPRTQEVITRTSNSIYATVDSSVIASAATMAAVQDKVWFSVPDIMPASMQPENPEDYLYVQWYVDGTAFGNQPFTMTFEDLAENNYISYMDTETGQPVILDSHPLILGSTYTADGDVLSDEYNSVSGTLFDGYTNTEKAAYVWVAYPKSDFAIESINYTLHNTHTVYVTGHDDEITTFTQGSGSVAFRMPTTWRIDIVWEDNDNEKERRPDQVYAWIEDKLKANNATAVSFYFDKDDNVVVGEPNIWHAEWVDDGSVADYDALEVSRSVTYDRTALISGIGDIIYHNDGSTTYTSWSYYNRLREYDPETHTWTFHNKYVEYTTGKTAWLITGRKDAENHQDTYQKSLSDKDLLRLLHDQPTTDLRYNVAADAWILRQTAAENANLEDSSTYGQRYVTVEALDKRNFFRGNELSEGDYQISSVVLRPGSLYSWTPDADGNGTGKEVYSGPATLSLDGWNGTSWIHFADYTTSATTMNGASSSGPDSNVKINLPSGILQVRVRTRTNEARARFDYDVNINILPSPLVKGAVEDVFVTTDYAMIVSYNEAEMTLYTDDGTPIIAALDEASTYMHGRNYKVAVDMDKSAEYIGKDDISRNMIIKNTVTLTQQSTVGSKTDFDDAVRDGDIVISKSGILYDLLPPGMTPDFDSITIDDGEILTLDAIENYQGSGRYLIKLHIRINGNAQNTALKRNDVSGWPHEGDSTYPESGVRQKNTITYNMLYSYDEAYSRDSTGIRNHVAYEADEEGWGDYPNWMSEPDDPTAGYNAESTAEITDPEIKALMTDLDGLRSDNAFVYASCPVDITEMDFSALIDLTKVAQIMGRQTWSRGWENELVAYEGQKYVYKLQMTSGTDAKAKNIIMFDSFENYQLKQTDVDYDSGNQWSWKGKFLSLDLNKIVAMGIAPVVWYSTVQDMVISEDWRSGTAVPRDQLAEPVWSTTPPADPGEVTAIAIDCSTDINGNQFILENNTSLIAYVYMKAPTYDDDSTIFDANDYTDASKNAHAYNNAWADSTIIDEGGNEEDSWTHNDYTKIGIAGGRLNVLKEWNDKNNNDRIRPDSVDIELYCNEQPTGKILTLSADQNWRGTFEHVAPYDENGMMNYYTIVEQEVPDYTSQSSSGSRTEIMLTNTHELYKVDVPFSKRWESSEPDGWQSNIPASITAKLYADGEYTGKTMTVRPAQDGTWSGVFMNMQKLKNGVEIVYTVEEVPVQDFIPTKEVDGDGHDVLVNTYYPYGDITVEKHIVNGTPLALEKGFTFTMTLRDKTDPSLPDTGKYDYVIRNTEEEEVETGVIGNGDTFVLHDGEKITISEIPSGTTYRFQEEECPGFSILRRENDTNTVKSGITEAAKFTNRYASVGRMSLGVRKDLAGNSLKRYQFQFYVLNMEGTQIRSSSNQADGTVTFGSIRYTEADNGLQKVYKIIERNNNKPGYTYDDSMYYVVVTPADNGEGKMICTPAFYVEQEAGSAGAPDLTLDVNGTPLNLVSVQSGDLMFRNSYEASGTLEIRAWKVMPQRALRDNEFTFNLIYSGCLREGETEPDMTGAGTVIDTATNLADGTVLFSPMLYEHSAADPKLGMIYYYTIKEVSGSDPTVIYDEHTYGYSVKPIDNGDGTLSFNQDTIDAGNMYSTCFVCGGTGFEGEVDAQMWLYSYGNTSYISVEIPYSAFTDIDAFEDVMVNTSSGWNTSGNMQFFEFENASQYNTSGIDVPANWFQALRTEITMNPDTQTVELGVQFPGDFTAMAGALYRITLPYGYNIVGDTTNGVFPTFGSASEAQSGVYDSCVMPSYFPCTNCNGQGEVLLDGWATTIALFSPEFHYDETAQILTMSYDGFWDKGNREESKTGTITWYNRVTDNVIETQQDGSISIAKAFTEIAPDNRIFGSTASFIIEGDSGTYIGSFIIPEYEVFALSSDGKVTVDIYGMLSGELPVFRNRLKDGSFSVEKQLTALDMSAVDETQEFTFRVVLIGEDIEDGELSWNLEYRFRSDETIVMNWEEEPAVSSATVDLLSEPGGAVLATITLDEANGWTGTLQNVYWKNSQTPPVWDISSVTPFLKGENLESENILSTYIARTTTLTMGE